MSVEILLIQKGILFLGHSTQAVAVTLFALLTVKERPLPSTFVVFLSFLC